MRTRLYWKRIPPRQAQGDIAVPAGATPLYRAAKSMDLQSMRLLVAKGGDPSLGIADNSTPLMVACGLGARPRGGEDDVIEKPGRPIRSTSIKLFVEAGADVDAINDLGNTALHYAALTGATRIVEYLAGTGAKLDIRNFQGKTALDLARGASGAALRKLMDSPARQ